MKTMLLIFALVLCGADALSVRNQNPGSFYTKTDGDMENMEPVLLASHSRNSSKPNSPNASKEEQDNMKTLGEMEATLMRLAKTRDSGTPLKSFADLISPILDSMVKKINDAHTAAQTTVDNLGGAFTTCTTGKTTGENAASTLFTTAKSKSASHKTCRTMEGTLETNYQNCQTEHKSLKSAKDTSCKAYNLANKVPNIDLVPKPGQGASYRSWLVSVKEWVIAELANLDSAKSSCDSATKLFNSKDEECYGASGKKSAYTKKKSACDLDQTTLEEGTCAYAAKSEDTCVQYGACYTTAATAYQTEIANLQQAQAARVTEYGLVKRLQCFCGLFSKADGADLKGAEIDACIAKTHSTTHLELKLPALPRGPEACQAVAEKPCTAHYLTKYYGSLPVNAPAKACTACPPSSLQPVEDVTCEFTVDNYVTKVYLDGTDKTGAVTGNLRSWPTKKTLKFKSSVRKMAFHVNDAEQGCRNGGFAISCKSKATAWTMSSNSKKGWKVFSVKGAGGSGPPAVGGKQWYETGYSEGSGFKEPRFGSTTYADRVIKTDGKNTEDFCGGDSDSTKNYWWFTYHAPLPPPPLALFGGCKDPSAQKAEPVKGSIVACAASGSGHISKDFNDVCAEGWKVCDGQQVWDSSLTYDKANGFPGCYKYDAAHDCRGCGVTCESREIAAGSSLVPCWDSGRGIDVAGMGSDCPTNNRGTDSCTRSGRIDFASNNGGCSSALRDGVMCCKVTTLTPKFSMPASGNLMLDFRGGVGVSDTEWKDQAKGVIGTVPVAVKYDATEKAWLFPGKGSVITVPLATNPSKMTAVTYSGWVKPLDYQGTLGWVLTQYPDFGWSRSITMSDGRLGGTGVTPGGYNSGLGNLPLNKWSHVAGVWTSRGGDCWIYANMKKYKRTCSNGQGSNNNEKFIIGGRGPNDGGHNAKVMVTDVGVWNKALTEDEVKLLYNGGKHPTR